MRNEITYTDLFAGIGGFRLGLEKANQISTNPQPGLGDQKGQSVSCSQRGRGRKLQKFHCVWSNEWDKYCAKIYEKNFGEAPDTRDIRTIPSGEIPDHDLLCAGFPCPTFSIAGKGKGFEDTRGAVFFEIPRILRDKRPRHLLLENVKGLLSHQEGETFQTILGVLSDLGYRCEWQVLNSKNFGVPQNRERVFIVGHLGGEPWKQIFPLRQGEEFPHTEKQEKQGKRQGISSTIDARYGALRDAGETYVIHDKRQAGELRVQKEPCVTKHYGTGGGNVPMVFEDFYPDRIRTFKQSPTLRGDRQGLKVKKETKIRRLTPIECERLQGFPDNFTKGVSDTQRYRMLGNAVTVNVVEAIGRKLREHIECQQ